MTDDCHEFLVVNVIISSRLIHGLRKKGNRMPNIILLLLQYNGACAVTRGICFNSYLLKMVRDTKNWIVSESLLQHIKGFLFFMSPLPHYISGELIQRITGFSQVFDELLIEVGKPSEFSDM